MRSTHSALSVAKHTRARRACVSDAKHTQCLVRRKHTRASQACVPDATALEEPCPSRSTCMLWWRCGRNKLLPTRLDEHVARTRATRTSQMLAQPSEARHERLAATCTCCNHTKQRGCFGCLAQPAGASDCSVQLRMRVGERSKLCRMHASLACVRCVLLRAQGVHACGMRTRTRARLPHATFLSESEHGSRSRVRTRVTRMSC